jgi:hypothetical protein
MKLRDGLTLAAIVGSLALIFVNTHLSGDARTPAVVATPPALTMRERPLNYAHRQQPKGGDPVSPPKNFVGPIGTVIASVRA